MKFDISRTNGGQWSLELGNSRFGEYDEINDLFKDLEIMLKLYKKNKDET